MQNRVFFPQSALDQWIVDNKIDLAGSDLTIMSASRRYKLGEAIYVKAEVTGTADANDLVGRVKSRSFLDELGAEIMDSSMIIGDNAYDVVLGWLGIPDGTFEDYLASAER